MNFSQLFVFSGLLTGAASVQAAPVITPNASLPAESNGLKISISPTFAGDELNLSISLHRSDPHLNIVLQNTSDKPIRVYQDWNSWGYFNLTLQITAVDGKALDKPLNIGRGPGVWFANVPTTDFIGAGQAVVREVHLNLPAEIFDSKKPASDKKSGVNWRRYFGFPFPPADNSRTLTMRAMFNNSDNKGTGGKDAGEVWTGAVASPSESYRFFWGDD